MRSLARVGMYAGLVAMALVGMRAAAETVPAAELKPAIAIKLEDCDGDGKITLDDFLKNAPAEDAVVQALKKTSVEYATEQAFLTAEFKRLDADKNGELTVAEFIKGNAVAPKVEICPMPEKAAAATPAIKASPEVCGAYVRTLEIGKGEFQQLSAVAIDGKGSLYGSGASRKIFSGTVKAFSGEGKLLQGYDVANDATGVAVDGSGCIYVAGRGKTGFVVEKLTPAADKPATHDTWTLDKAVKNVASMRLYKDTLLIADAGGCIHKVSAADGKYLGAVGGGKPGSVRINTCCGILGFDVDATGRLFIGNLGQHRVTACELDNSKVVHFGKPGESDADFCGCCNPVCVAVMADGKIVTSEKTIPRIKVYAADGKTLLALIAGKEFRADCSELALVVDAKGVIYAADGDSKSIKVFAPK